MKKYQTGQKSRTEELISIIIPAHNEEKYLERCLASIQAQSYTAYEIIVVLNATTDAPKSIAMKYTHQVYALREKSVSKARNLGAAKAKGSILMFLDADCTISKNLLFAMNHALRDKNVGAITQTKSLEDRWKAHLFWFMGNCGRYFFRAGSGMIACKKKAFPGFNEQKCVAEDTVLIKKLQKKGNVAYLTHAYIRTSARRMEKEGYFYTFYKQCKGYFIKDFNQY